MVYPHCDGRTRRRYRVLPRQESLPLGSSIAPEWGGARDCSPSPFVSLMDALTLATGDLNAVFVFADDLANAVGGTFGSNVGWLILIATAANIMVILLAISYGHINLGAIRVINFKAGRMRKRRLKSLSKEYGGLDNVPLGQIDIDEYNRVNRL